MAPNKILNNLSEYQKDLGLRVFDLVIGGVFKRIYLSLDEKGKENMEKVFLSDNDKEKEKFIKKQMPNFKKLFKAEAEKIEKEIKVELKNHI